MLKYTKYLLSSICREKAPYIIIAIFFLIFNFTTWISIREVNQYFQSNIDSLSTFDKFFPFLFSTLFIAMIVIYTFKKGESNGSELMVVAKPISRIQIIFGKFIALYIYIIFFSVLATLNYLLISLVDKYAGTMDKIWFALSLGVGGFVVLIIISSILVILASILNRTSLLSFGVVLSSIVPILSFTISPIAQGQPFSRYNFASSNVNQLKIDQLKNIDKMQDILQDPDAEINLKDLEQIFDPETIYIDSNFDYETDYLKYKNDIWYNKAAFADIWYQWGKFYSMFQSHKKTPTMIGKWDRKTKLVKANKQEVININNDQKDKYVLYVKQSALSKANKYLPLLNDIARYIRNHRSDFNKLSLFDRLNFIQSVLNLYPENRNKDFSSFSSLIKIKSTSPDEFNQKLTYAGSLAATIYALLVQINKQVHIFDDPTSAYPNQVKIKTNEDGIDTYQIQDDIDKVLLSPRMARVGSKIYVYEGKDFIKNNITIIVWMSLAVLFLSGAIFAFIKRDFK